jgi:hypothetical protein
VFAARTATSGKRIKNILQRSVHFFKNFVGPQGTVDVTPNITTTIQKTTFGICWTFASSVTQSAKTAVGFRIVFHLKIKT